jgi:hypothetical protein
MSLSDDVEERGYAVVEPVLAAAEVAALRASREELPVGERQGGFRDVLNRVPAVLRCALDPRILSLAESVLGAGSPPAGPRLMTKWVSAPAS